MRRPVGLLALAVAAGVGGAVLPPFSPEPASGQPAGTSGERVEEGRRLYVTGCSSCHGLDASGTEAAPPLIGTGAASVHFWVSTGRMPLARPGLPVRRKPPAYDREQIAALVAYVTSLGPGGPPIPDVDLDAADVVRGGALYRANCAACHQAAGIGGALSYGRQAPALDPATPLEVAEAIRVGPGAMPVFGPETLSERDVNDVVRYVHELDRADDPGGLGLGRAGPIPEGLVSWLIGLGALLGVCWWMGERG